MLNGGLLVISYACIFEKLYLYFQMNLHANFFG